jgi:hypothetical protein
MRFYRRRWDELRRLRPHHAEDGFGGLSAVGLDPDEWSAFEINIGLHRAKACHYQRQARQPCPPRSAALWAWAACPRSTAEDLRKDQYGLLEDFLREAFRARAASAGQAGPQLFVCRR